ncbi:MAG: methionine--tRNA ligase [Clostridiales bacterium]|nr:methionine--tRNA ligase [Clostridiales bacterium]
MCNCYEHNKGSYYITTAIAYASGKPHIGNTYDVVMADAVARRKRQEGYDVFFMTGTDEHGLKIENLAAKAGISPKEYVDRVSDEVKEVWASVGSSHDKFMRTTDDYHVETIQRVFKKLYEQGDIYKGSYEGWYCVPCESFFTETQVVDGKCPDCGRPVEKANEEAYFFKMSKYQDKLLQYIEEHPDFIEPELRRKEMVNNFIKPGLQDLCVSRSSFKWGIPVDFDSKHVVYVWLDALFNYATGIGLRLDENGNVAPTEQFNKFWPCDVHVIGKDIMRFHSIYWTIFLMALGLPMPKKIFGHPWFNFGTDKMSKSRGNVIYADDLVKRFGIDGVRHYCLSEMPYSSDGSITYETIITRYNADLANNLGNLVNRTIAMTHKYFGGIIQSGDVIEPLDAELKAAAAEAAAAVAKNMDSFHLADASDAIFALLRRANKYIDETTPWVLAKDEASMPRLGTVLYNLLETIRIAAILLEPFMPTTSAAILDQLATDVRSLDSVDSFGGLKTGVSVGEGKPLFARIDEAKLLAEVEAERAEAIAKAEAAAKASEKPEGCAIIGIDDFMKVELRTAQVIACENVPKAKKLLKLQLDLGYEKRQVVSGIAKFYKPEDLIGKKLIVVANLAPAKLCGVESQGMIIASGEEQVRVIFLDPETPLGERVR